MDSHRWSRLATRTAAGSGDPIADIFRSTQAAQATDAGFVSLAAGAPDHRLLPVELAEELLRDLVGAGDAGWLGNYGDPQGLAALRHRLADWLGRFGVVCEPATVLVTSGGMDALTIAGELLVDPGDAVLVEAPAFPGALATFALRDATVVPVACDGYGMVPAALAEALERYRPTLVSLMPDHQNPTGWVAPPARRQELAALIEAAGTYAVEDGTYAALRYEGVACAPVQSWAPRRVLYVTSMSKIWLPAGRVGCLVAPPELIRVATAVKSVKDMQASTLHQALVERFLADHVGDHLATLLARYQARRDALVAALDGAFPPATGFRWERPSGGMFLWLRGPAEVDFEALLPVAIAAGVAYVPGTAFHVDGAAARHEARLSFTGATEEELRVAVDRLAGVLLGRGGREGVQLHGTR